MGDLPFSLPLLPPSPASDWSVPLLLEPGENDDTRMFSMDGLVNSERQQEYTTVDGASVRDNPSQEMAVQGSSQGHFTIGNGSGLLDDSTKGCNKPVDGTSSQGGQQNSGYPFPSSQQCVSSTAMTGGDKTELEDQESNVFHKMESILSEQDRYEESTMAVLAELQALAEDSATFQPMQHSAVTTQDRDLNIQDQPPKPSLSTCWDSGHIGDPPPQGNVSEPNVPLTPCEEGDIQPLRKDAPQADAQNENVNVSDTLLSPITSDIGAEADPVLVKAGSFSVESNDSTAMETAAATGDKIGAETMETGDITGAETVETGVLPGPEAKNETEKVHIEIESKTMRAGSMAVGDTPNEQDKIKPDKAHLEATVTDSKTNTPTLDMQRKTSPVVMEIDDKNTPGSVLNSDVSLTSSAKMTSSPSPSSPRRLLTQSSERKRSSPNPSTAVRYEIHCGKIVFKRRAKDGEASSTPQSKQQPRRSRRRTVVKSEPVSHSRGRHGSYRSTSPRVDGVVETAMKGKECKKSRDVTEDGNSTVSNIKISRLSGCKDASLATDLDPKGDLEHPPAVAELSPSMPVLEPEDVDLLNVNEQQNEKEATKSSSVPAIDEVFTKAGNSQSGKMDAGEGVADKVEAPVVKNIPHSNVQDIGGTGTKGTECTEGLKSAMEADQEKTASSITKKIKIDSHKPKQGYTFDVEPVFEKINSWLSNKDTKIDMLTEAQQNVTPNVNQTADEFQKGTTPSGTTKPAEVGSLVGLSAKSDVRNSQNVKSPPMESNDPESIKVQFSETTEYLKGNLSTVAGEVIGSKQKEGNLTAQTSGTKETVHSAPSQKQNVNNLQQPVSKKDGPTDSPQTLLKKEEENVNASISKTTRIVKQPTKVSRCEQEKSKKPGNTQTRRRVDPRYVSPRPTTRPRYVTIPDQFDQVLSLDLGQSSTFDLGQGLSFDLGEGSSYDLGQGSSFDLGEGSSFDLGQGSQDETDDILELENSIQECISAIMKGGGGEDILKETTGKRRQAAPLPVQKTRSPRRAPQRRRSRAMIKRTHPRPEQHSPPPIKRRDLETSQEKEALVTQESTKSQIKDNVDADTKTESAPNIAEGEAVTESEPLEKQTSESQSDEMSSKQQQTSFLPQQTNSSEKKKSTQRRTSGRKRKVTFNLNPETVSVEDRAEQTQSLADTGPPVLEMEEPLHPLEENEGVEVPGCHYAVIDSSRSSDSKSEPTLGQAENIPPKDEGQNLVENTNLEESDQLLNPVKAPSVQEKPGTTEQTLKANDQETAKENSQQDETEISSDKPELTPDEQGSSKEDLVTVGSPEFQFELQDYHCVKGRLGRMIYRCDICQGIYRHAFSLKRHYMRIHINPKYLSGPEHGTDGDGSRIKCGEAPKLEGGEKYKYETEKVPKKETGEESKYEKESEKALKKESNEKSKYEMGKKGKGSSGEVMEIDNKEVHEIESRELDESERKQQQKEFETQDETSEKTASHVELFESETDPAVVNIDKERTDNLKELKSSKEPYKNEDKSEGTKNLSTCETGIEDSSNEIEIVEHHNIDTIRHQNRCGENENDTEGSRSPCGKPENPKNFDTNEEAITLEMESCENTNSQKIQTWKTNLEQNQMEAEKTNTEVVAEAATAKDEQIDFGNEAALTTRETHHNDNPLDDGHIKDNTEPTCIKAGSDDTEPSSVLSVDIPVSSTQGNKDEPQNRSRPVEIQVATLDRRSEDLPGNGNDVGDVSEAVSGDQSVDKSEQIGDRPKGTEQEPETNAHSINNEVLTGSEDVDKAAPNDDNALVGNLVTPGEMQDMERSVTNPVNTNPSDAPDDRKEKCESDAQDNGNVVLKNITSTGMAVPDVISTDVGTDPVNLKQAYPYSEYPGEETAEPTGETSQTCSVCPESDSTEDKTIPECAVPQHFEDLQVTQKSQPTGEMLQTCGGCLDVDITQPADGLHQLSAEPEDQDPVKSAVEKPAPLGKDKAELASEMSQLRPESLEEKTGRSAIQTSPTCADSLYVDTIDSKHEGSQPIDISSHELPDESKMKPTLTNIDTEKPSVETLDNDSVVLSAIHLDNETATAHEEPKDNSSVSNHSEMGMCIATPSDYDFEKENDSKAQSADDQDVDLSFPCRDEHSEELRAQDSAKDVDSDYEKDDKPTSARGFTPGGDKLTHSDNTFKHDTAVVAVAPNRGKAELAAHSPSLDTPTSDDDIVSDNETASCVANTETGGIQKGSVISNEHLSHGNCEGAKDESSSGTSVVPSSEEQGDEKAKSSLDAGATTPTDTIVVHKREEHNEKKDTPCTDEISDASASHNVTLKSQEGEHDERAKVCDDGSFCDQSNSGRGDLDGKNSVTCLEDSVDNKTGSCVSESSEKDAPSKVANLNQEEIKDERVIRIDKELEKRPECNETEEPAQHDQVAPLSAEVPGCRERKPDMIDDSNVDLTADSKVEDRVVGRGISTEDGVMGFRRKPHKPDSSETSEVLAHCDEVPGGDLTCDEYTVSPSKLVCSQISSGQTLLKPTDGDLTVTMQAEKKTGYLEQNEKEQPKEPRARDPASSIGRTTTQMDDSITIKETNFPENNFPDVVEGDLKSTGFVDISLTKLISKDTPDSRMQAPVDKKPIASSFQNSDDNSERTKMAILNVQTGSDYENKDDKANLIPLNDLTSGSVPSTLISLDSSESSSREHTLLDFSSQQHSTKETSLENVTAAASVPLATSGAQSATPDVTVEHIPDSLDGDHQPQNMTNSESTLDPVSVVSSGSADECNPVHQTPPTLDSQTLNTDAQSSVDPLNAVSAGDTEDGTPSHNLTSESTPLANSNLQAPVLDMPGLFKCNLCTETFNSAQELREHLTNHPALPGKETFACTQCQMKFTSKPNLMRHQIVHTGAKPYECQKCGQDFPTVTHMRRHVQKMHCGNQQNQHQCDKCTESFARKVLLMKHISKEHSHDCETLTKGAKADEVAIGPDESIACPEQESVCTAEEERMSTEAESPVPDTAGEDVGQITEITNKEDVVSCSSRYEEKQGSENDEGSTSSDGLKTGHNGQQHLTVKHNLRQTRQREQKDSSRGETTSTFSYQCIVCKKRFPTYSQMCRHRRMAHERPKALISREKEKKSKPPPKDNDDSGEQDLNSRITFYAHISSNVAENLRFYLDGKDDALSNFHKHLRHYDKVHGFGILPEPKSVKLDLKKFNFTDEEIELIEKEQEDRRLGQQEQLQGMDQNSATGKVIMNDALQAEQHGANSEECENDNSQSAEVCPSENVTVCAISHHLAHAYEHSMSLNRQEKEGGPPNPSVSTSVGMQEKEHGPPNPTMSSSLGRQGNEEVSPSLTMEGGCWGEKADEEEHQITKVTEKCIENQGESNMEVTNIQCAVSEEKGRNDAVPSWKQASLNEKSEVSQLKGNSTEVNQSEYPKPESDSKSIPTKALKASLAPGQKENINTKSAEMLPVFPPSAAEQNDCLCEGQNQDKDTSIEKEQSKSQVSGDTVGGEIPVNIAEDKKTTIPALPSSIKSDQSSQIFRKEDNKQSNSNKATSEREKIVSGPQVEGVQSQVLESAQSEETDGQNSTEGKYKKLPLIHRCPVCKITFDIAADYINHLKKIHGIELPEDLPEEDPKLTTEADGSKQTQSKTKLARNMEKIRSLRSFRRGQSLQSIQQKGITEGGGRGDVDESSRNTRFDEVSQWDQGVEQYGRYPVQRRYICLVCWQDFPDFDTIFEHEVADHPNIYCRHIMIEKAFECHVFKHVHKQTKQVATSYNMTAGSGLESKWTPTTEKSPMLQKPRPATCTKCGKAFDKMADLHAHIIDDCASRGSLGSAHVGASEGVVKTIEDKTKRRGIKHRIVNLQVVSTEVKKTYNSKGFKEKRSEGRENTGLGAIEKIKLKQPVHISGGSSSTRDKGKFAKDTTQWVRKSMKQQQKKIEAVSTKLKKRQQMKPWKGSPFKCHYCSKDCGSPLMLRKHTAVCQARLSKIASKRKTNTSPFKAARRCQYCGKAFVYQGSWYNHLNIYCKVKKILLSDGKKRGETNNGKDKEAKKHDAKITRKIARDKVPVDDKEKSDSKQPSLFKQKPWRLRRNKTGGMLVARTPTVDTSSTAQIPKITRNTDSPASQRAGSDIVKQEDVHIPLKSIQSSNKALVTRKPANAFRIAESAASQKIAKSRKMLSSQPPTGLRPKVNKAGGNTKGKNPVSSEKIIQNQSHISATKVSNCDSQLETLCGKASALERRSSSTDDRISKLINNLRERIQDKGNIPFVSRETSNSLGEEAEAASSQFITCVQSQRSATGKVNKREGKSKGDSPITSALEKGQAKIIESATSFIHPQKRKKAETEQGVKKMKVAGVEQRLKTTNKKTTKSAPRKTMGVRKELNKKKIETLKAKSHQKEAYAAKSNNPKDSSVPGLVSQVNTIKRAVSVQGPKRKLQNTKGASCGSKWAKKIKTPSPVNSKRPDPNLLVLSNEDNFDAQDEDDIPISQLIQKKGSAAVISSGRPSKITKKDVPGRQTSKLNYDSPKTPRKPQKKSKRSTKDKQPESVSPPITNHLKVVKHISPCSVREVKSKYDAKDVEDIIGQNPKHYSNLPDDSNAGELSVSGSSKSGDKFSGLTKAEKKAHGYFQGKPKTKNGGAVKKLSLHGNSSIVRLPEDPKIQKRNSKSAAASQRAIEKSKLKTPREITKRVDIQPPSIKQTEPSSIPEEGALQDGTSEHNLPTDVASVDGYDRDNESYRKFLPLKKRKAFSASSSDVDC